MLLVVAINPVEHGLLELSRSAERDLRPAPAPFDPAAHENDPPQRIPGAAHHVPDPPGPHGRRPRPDSNARGGGKARMIYPPATVPPASRLTTDARVLEAALEPGREATLAQFAE